MLALKVPKKQADEIRKILLQNSLLNLDLKIKRTDDFVFLPLNEKISPDWRDKSKILSFETVETEFELLKRGPRSLKEQLKGKIPREKMEEIKKSFDIIGDVVILEIPEDLEGYKYQIGQAALEFTRRKAVFQKKSKVKGVIRTRELEYLAGEDVSETIYTEYGSRFMLDVRKVYFSPRLATEREILSNQVKDGEIIVDMFAGVGPFSIAIARRRVVKIYAIDINPDAIYYLKKNIELNQVQEKVIPLKGDVRVVLKDKKIRANRIIMNLPGTAYEFLENAIGSLKEGGILHYYEFSSDFQKPVDRIKRAAGSREVKILDKRRVKSRSPGVWHVGIDAVVL